MKIFFSSKWRPLKYFLVGVISLFLSGLTLVVFTGGLSRLIFYIHAEGAAIWISDFVLVSGVYIMISNHTATRSKKGMTGE
jgi:uncharacterized protein YybS (DUF2232 family)